MRKLVMALLASAPAAAFAQVDAPFDRVAGNMLGMMHWIAPVMITLAMLAFVAKALLTGKFSLAPLVCAGVMAMSVSFVAKFFGTEPADNAGPDFSGLLDWTMRYGAAILGTIVLSAILAFTLHRRHARTVLHAQLQADLQLLLKTIQLADLVEAYWGQRMDQIAATTRVAKVQTARTSLMSLLEQVHAGRPLDAKQRAQMLKQIAEVSKAAVNSEGQPLDPEAEPAEVPTRARLATPASTGTPRANRRPEPAQSSARACSCISTCMCSPMMGSLVDTVEHSSRSHRNGAHQLDSNNGSATDSQGCDLLLSTGDTRSASDEPVSSPDTSTSCNYDSGNYGPD